MRKTAIVLAFLFLGGLSVTAQEQDGRKDSTACVFGRVLDGRYGEKANLGITQASALLIPLQAGVRRDTLHRTVITGNFRFDDVPAGRAFLKIFCPGMQTLSGQFELAPGQNVFLFTMEPEAEKLEGALVQGEMPLVTHSKDTVRYHVAAVRVMEDDRLRSALEQFPGFEVSDLGIKVDGEPVKRTYVNGILLFGNNVMTAVNALKASEVSQVSVYSEQDAEDRRRNLQHSKKEKVLDIATKESILSLSELLAYAAGGADDTGQLRYTGAVAAASYAESLQLAGGVTADNSSKDLGAVNGITPSNVLSSLSGTPSTLSFYEEKTVTDLHFEKHWKDRAYGNTFTGEYKFVHRHNRSSRFTETLHYGGENGSGRYTLLDSLDVLKTSARHHLNLALNLLDTPLKSVYWQVDADFGKDYTSQDTRQAKLYDGASLSGAQTERSEGLSYHLFSLLRWRNNDLHRFRPKASLSATLEASDTPSALTDTLLSSWLRRRLVSEGTQKGRSLHGEFELEWLGHNDESKTLSLWGRVESTYTDKEVERYAENLLGPVPETDPLNTFYYFGQQRNHVLAAGLSCHTSSLHVDAAINVDNTRLFDRESIPSPVHLSRAFWFILPSVGLKYKQFNLESALRKNLPALEQLRNRVTDTNPLMLSMGNPELDAFYSWDSKISWGRTIKSVGTQLILFHDHRFGEIVSRHRFFAADTPLGDWMDDVAKAGSSLYTFANATECGHTSQASLHFNRLFFQGKLSANLHLSGAFSKEPIYQEETPSALFTRTFSLSPSFTFTPNPKMKYILRTGLSHARSKDQTGQPLLGCILGDLSATANIRFTPKVKMAARYFLQSYHYLEGHGLDLHRHRLGLKVDWILVKDKWVLGLEANDLLNGGSLYKTAMTAESFSQTWTPAYGRFFLLSAKYFFRRK